MFKYILTILKILLAVAMIPASVAVSLSLVDHLYTYPTVISSYFMYGGICFLLIFLFFYQFWGFYEFGYKVLISLFQFAAPLDKFLAYAVPVYSVIALLVYYIVRALIHVDTMDHIFSFFVGFTFFMHIVVLAQELQNQEKTQIKPDYLFLMNLIYILDVFLIVMLFDLVFQKWSIPIFWGSFVKDAEYVYGILMKTVWPF